jgi:hypothetical protein
MQSEKLLIVTKNLFLITEGVIHETQIICKSLTKRQMLQQYPYQTIPKISDQI